MLNRPVRVWYRRNRRRLRRFVYHNVLHADDPPRKIAMGLALGVFVAFTPTVGIQMVVAGFLSWLLRVNKAVAMAAVWISNPATMLPIYWYCYRIGAAVTAQDPIGRSWWSELTHPPVGWWPAVSFYWTRFVDIAGPLWLGGIIVGFIAAYPVYYATYHLIRYHRLRRWGRLVPPGAGLER